MSVLAGALFMLPVISVLPAAAQSCRWAGTAPLCNGACSGNETEITRLDKIPDGWVSPFVNISPPFGAKLRDRIEGFLLHRSARHGLSMGWHGSIL
jgi:hypothetical protein